MGTTLIKRSDMSRYVPLMADIKDQFGYGINVYPKSLTVSHDMHGSGDYILFQERKSRKTAMMEIKKKGGEPGKSEETSMMYH